MDVRNYSCQLCNKSCNSSEQLRMHQSSKAHISKCVRSISESDDKVTFYTPNQATPESEKNFERCFICQKELTPAQLMSHHCYGETQGSQLDSLIATDFAYQNAPVLQAYKPAKQKCTPEVYECGTCGITLNSKEQFTAHLTGKKHQKRINGNPEAVKPNTMEQKNTHTLGLNQMMCEICKVPIQKNIFEAHRLGKTHFWNVVSSGQDKTVAVNFSWVSPYSIQRDFRPYVNLLPQLPDFDQKALLLPLSLSDSDALVVINRGEILRLGAALCLSLLLANRRPGLERSSANLPPACQCFSVWLCSTKRTVIQISELLRKYLANIHILAIPTNPTKPPCIVWSSGDVANSPSVATQPVRLATLLRDYLVFDEPTLSINQHDIVLSTPGGLKQFLGTMSDVKNTICGMVIVGAETTAKNGEMEKWIENLIRYPNQMNNRPRCFCLCEGIPQPWSVLHRLHLYNLLR